MLRIIHSSDVHLGKSFGFLDDETAPPLRDARFAVLSRLGELAQKHGASHVLLAGDTFDAVQTAMRLSTAPSISCAGRQRSRGT